MVRIDDQVRKIVQHIKAAEAKQAHWQKKVEAIAPQGSGATEQKATSLEKIHSTLQALLHSTKM